MTPEEIEISIQNMNLAYQMYKVGYEQFASMPSRKLPSYVKKLIRAASIFNDHRRQHKGLMAAEMIFCDLINLLIFYRQVVRTSMPKDIQTSILNELFAERANSGLAKSHQEISTRASKGNHIGGPFSAAIDATGLLWKTTGTTIRTRLRDAGKPNTATAIDKFLIDYLGSSDLEIALKNGKPVFRVLPAKA